MSKRKFQEISSSNPTTSVRLGSSQQRQRERLLGYLEDGQTQLLGGLKLARGFERQKLGRRQKDARNKNEQDGNSKDVGRIDAEIRALKALDLNDAAKFYIARTLCRIKTISSSPVMPKELLKEGTAPSPYRDSASANVTARLFKSAAVRNAMDSIEKKVREIVVVRKQESQHKEVTDEQHETVARSEGTASQGGASEFSDIEDEDNITGSESGQIAPTVQHRGSSENLDDTDIDKDAYQDRLASSSESELDSDIKELYESDDASSRSQNNVQAKVLTSVLQTTSPKPTKSGQSITKPTGLNSKPTTKTTFLPTLASGYISGSDSDSFASEIEQTTEKPKRKNRMGQQARRALAEQQYGAAANHLKNQSGKKNKGRGARDVGWDFNKGAVNDRAKNHNFDRRNLKSNAEPDTNDGTNARKAKPRAKDDTGQLHPSWIAKKKMKEQQNQGIAVFQGKKMVFD